jgi:phosphatidylglycerol---prolipoprotein diacylglyceryl transferase
VFPVLFHIGPLFVPAYGVLTAAGVLLGLAVLLRTSSAVGLNPNQLWNLSIVALFAALAGSRAVLVALNWAVVRSHPAWLLDLAMVHHPFLAAIGALFAAAAALVYAHRFDLPLGNAADALAAPLLLALSCEQIGALLAGSGFGSETIVPWAVVYTDPLAARWSGAPLFVPLHPVQAYAALGMALIGIALLVWMPHRRRPGDVSGIAVMAAGAAVFVTEFWRDPEGRGSLFGGALDAPQLFAVALVLAGAWSLLERTAAPTGAGRPAGVSAADAGDSHG